MLKLVQTFKGNRNSWCVCHNQINTKSKSWINTASIFAKMSICSRKKTDNLCDFGLLSFGHSIVLIAYLSRWLWFLFFLVGSSILSSENYDVFNRKKREIRKLMWILVNGMCWYDDLVVQLHRMSDGRNSMSNDPLIISAKDDNLES